jgi:hypothetical protein
VEREQVREEVRAEERAALERERAEERAALERERERYEAVSIRLSECACADICTGPSSTTRTSRGDPET